MDAGSVFGFGIAVPDHSEFRPLAFKKTRRSVPDERHRVDEDVYALGPLEPTNEKHGEALVLRYVYRVEFLDVHPVGNDDGGVDVRMPQKTRSNGDFRVIAKLREQELLYVVEKPPLALIEQIRTVYCGNYGLAEHPSGDFSGKQSEKGMRVNDVVRGFSALANNRAGNRKYGKDSFEEMKKRLRASASEDSEFSIEKDFVGVIWKSVVTP